VKGIPGGVVAGTTAGGVVRGGSGAGGCGVTAGAAVLAGAGIGIVTGVEDGVLAGVGVGAVRRSPPPRSRPGDAGIPVVRVGSDVPPPVTENAIAEGDAAVVVGCGTGLPAAASVGR
jgi:hypothetical protein